VVVLVVVAVDVEVIVVVVFLIVVVVDIKNSLLTHFPPGPHEISSKQFVAFKEDCFIQTPL